jgi:hypothetical protein
MVNSANFFIQTFDAGIDRTNTSIGTDSAKLAGNDEMNTAGGELEGDVLKVSKDPSKANIIAANDALERYDEQVIKNHGKPEEVARLDNQFHELLSVLGGSGSTSAGSASLNDIVQYMQDYGTQSSGANFGADGAIGEATNSMKAAYAAYTAICSGSSKDKEKAMEAVLSTLNAVTTVMDRDGETKAQRDAFRSSVEGLL